MDDRGSDKARRSGEGRARPGLTPSLFTLGGLLPVHVDGLELGWVRTVRRAALGCAMITLTLSGMRFGMEGAASSVGWLLVVVSVALAASPLWLRTSAPRMAGVWVPLVGLIGTVAMAWMDTGMRSEALYFVVAVPLAAAFLLGARAALWFGACGEVGLALVWAGDGALVLSEGVPDPTVLHLLGAGGAVGFATLLGWTYETQRREEAARREGTIQTLRRVQGALIDARDRAEAANRAKDNFLTHMSHELRTPLNAVIGFSRLVASRAADTLDDKSRAYLDRIDANGTALLTLVQDILDLTMIESGRIDLSVAQLQLAPLLAEVEASLRDVAQSKGTTLQVRAPADLVVEADPARLRQVLAHIVGNAVKFAPKGEVEVEVQGEGGQAVAIVVHDDGIGIAGEDLDAVFLPFVQGEEGTARRFGGSGLGLGFARALCQAMGFELTLQSTLGRGTTVTIDLTAGRDPSRSATAPRETSDVPAGP